MPVTAFIGLTPAKQEMLPGMGKPRGKDVGMKVRVVLRSQLSWTVSFSDFYLTDQA